MASGEGNRFTQSLVINLSVIPRTLNRLKIEALHVGSRNDLHSLENNTYRSIASAVMMTLLRPVGPSGMPLARSSRVPQGRSIDQRTHGARRRLCVGPCQVEWVSFVAGGITSRGDAEAAAGVEVVARDIQVALQRCGRLDEGGHEARDDVPLDVAVEQVHARVVGEEPECHEAAGVNRGRVAPARARARRLQGTSRIVAAVGGASRDDLVAITVRVPGVRAVLSRVGQVQVAQEEKVERMKKGVK